MTTDRNKAAIIISKNLKRYRKSAGLTQIALGLKIGKNAEYISQIERRVALPSVEVLFTIAAVLNIKPYDFLREE